MANPKEVLYDWGGLNAWLLKSVNGLSGEGSYYDVFMQLISHISESRNFPYFFLAMALWAGLSILGRWRRNDENLKSHASRWAGTLIVFGVAFAVNAGIVLFLKEFFAFPRPYVVFGDTAIVVLESIRSVNDYRSFPSGHVGFAAIFVASLWPMLGDKAQLFFAGWVLLVAWSRMAVGMHFPADTLTSIFIAIMVAAMVRHFCAAGLKRTLGIQC